MPSFAFPLVLSQDKRTIFLNLAFSTRSHDPKFAPELLSSNEFNLRSIFFNPFKSFNCIGIDFMFQLDKFKKT